MDTLRLIAFVVMLIGSTALPTCAHPLGNFTINHLTKLTVGPSRVGIKYVLDMAEIPTYQMVGESRSHVQLANWARSEAPSLLAQLQLSCGGVPQNLVLDSAQAMARPGAGGLPTLYLVVDAHIQRASTDCRGLRYVDGTFPGRLGWRDIVLAPAREPTHELTHYPSMLTVSPRDITAVDIEPGHDGRLVVRSGVTAVATDAPTSQLRSNQLSDMLARGTNDWRFVLLTIIVAFGLGALHALEPGHGKTLLAISLVGARATVQQAAILAAALTIAHTIGVLALGLAINLFKGTFVPESVYPWITLISGIVIAIIGARSVQQALHGRLHGHQHTQLGHADDHAHAHGVGRTEDDRSHARSHAIPRSGPLSFRGTVWAAMSGGIAPCPAALVVLFAALALNQVVYGMFVIVAFSVGLAATLTGLGVTVVRGARWLHDRPQLQRFVAHGPLISAVSIASIGAIIVGQGFAQQGSATSPVAVTLIVAIAIAGYALSHPFAHRHTKVA